MEIWKPIEEFDGFYEVSNLGRVRSIDRVVKSAPSVGTRIQKGAIKAQAKKDNGYMVVNLWFNGKQHMRYAHRLVAQAFIPNPDGKPTIDHIDRNKENNCVENLRWATQSEQERNKRPDRKKTGPKPKEVLNDV